MITLVEDRFWAKVIKSQECWLWKAARSPRGYGIFYDGNRLVYAHRVSWSLANGEIPQGMNVLHRCDTPECVNPKHLFLGTQSDNLLDCRKKNRLTQAKKLTIADARKIRSLRKEGFHISSIASGFKISGKQVYNVLQNKQWKEGK